MVRAGLAGLGLVALPKPTVLVDRTTVADQFYPSVVSRSDREKQLVAKLNVEVRDLAFYDTPLLEFVEALQDIADVPVAIDNARARGRRKSTPRFPVFDRALRYFAAVRIAPDA